MYNDMLQYALLMQSELQFFGHAIYLFYVTVPFIMHSLILVLLRSESKVHPSNEANSKHKERTQLSTSGYLIIYFQSIISMHC